MEPKMWMPDRRVVLASQSPRRQELLKQIGLTFEVIPANIRERIGQTKPERIVQDNAEAKALWVYRKCMEQAAQTQTEPDGRRLVVIAADTMVTLDGKCMGKPSSVKEAQEMLTELQGRTHEVYTGVALAWQTDTGREYLTGSEGTRVVLYAMTKREIQDYIRSGEGMDKAGAYGIQTRFAIYVNKIFGDYTNVVGLPLGRLYHMLKAAKLL